MKTPHLCAGIRRVLWQFAACSTLLLSLTACATRVEWTPQPDPGLAWNAEPGFSAWTDGIKPVSEAMLSASPLPLPERLRLPDGRRLLPTWTGLSDDSLSSPNRTAKSRSKSSGTGYSQVGTASWYGPDFHGKLTANGETYNQESMTAAHQTLPFNSVVQVKNLNNGKTANVRINNRGPYVGGRIIDLSVGAAKALGCYDKGLARVEIRRVQ